LLSIPLAAPHFAITRSEEPDFLDRFVSYGEGCVSGAQLEVGEASADQSKQHPDI
jgi:hypothetical protein